MKKKILFPTDFSEVTNHAFLYALQLAKKIDAELLVLHCYEIPILSSVSGGNPDLIQESYESIELAEFEKFKKKAAAMRKMAEAEGLGNIPMNFDFKEGVFTQIMKEVAEKEKVDFVVMATKGIDSIEDRLFGSNTLHVTENLNVPILTIPKGHESYKIDRISVATMLRDSDKDEMDFIVEIANQLGASVDAIYISTDDEEKIEGKLDEWITLYGPKGVKFHALIGETIEDAIFDFVDEHHIDLMCVIKRQMGFFEKLFKGSLSKKLVGHSYIPLLILREEKE